MLDVLDFGAVGDGKSHPLSSRFSSLAAARVVYPRATFLNEEIDAHALQLAIDRCPIGGTVLVPRNASLRVNFTVKLWKAITLQGTGRDDSSTQQDEHHPQIRVIGEIAGIAYDDKGFPTGTAPKAFYNQGARIAGLRFRGDSHSSSHKSIGIRANLFWLGEIDHCHFSELGTAISVNGSWVWNVHHNQFVGTGFALRGDVTCTACGNTRGWYQVNAGRFEHNAVNGVSYGVFLYAPMNSISINENTIEKCAEAAVVVASYGTTAGLDGATGAWAVEIRGNYFEKNAVTSVQLGLRSPSAEKQLATAPRNVLVTQNQCNFDTGESCIDVYALRDSRIAENSVRFGKGKSADVRFRMEYDAPLVDGAVVIAERGHQGTPQCRGRCDTIEVRPRLAARDYNDVYFSASAPGRLESEAGAKTMEAGERRHPLASVSLLRSYLRNNGSFVDPARPLRLLFDASSHGRILLEALPYAVRVEPAPGALSHTVKMAGIEVRDVSSVAIDGRGALLLKVEDESPAALSFTRTTASVAHLDLAYAGRIAAAGSVGLSANEGSVVYVEDLRFLSSLKPQHGIAANGGVVIFGTASSPPAGAVRVVAPQPSYGGLVVRSRAETHRTGPPEAGDYDAGEVVWNTAVGPGRPLGWVCASSTMCTGRAAWFPLDGPPLRASVPLHLGRIDAGQCARDVMVDVAGARMGAECAIGLPPTFPSGLHATCFVSRSDAVNLRVCNSSPKQIDVATDVYRVRLFND